MGLSQMRLVWGIVLAIQAQVGLTIPFNGQVRVVTANAIGDYTYQGCYAEPSGSRALETVTTDALMTLDMCATICAASTKSKYFGVEYGKECWCGNTLSAQATVANAESECSFKCPGNATENCGAGSRLSLFMNANVVPPSGPAAKQAVGDYTYQGCFTDAGAKRALSKVYTDSAMTVEKCVSYCEGSVYLGVEYSGECWCGSTLGATSVLATAETECNMACKGDANTLCGGSSRLNLYKASVSVTSSSSSMTTSTPSAVPTNRVGDYLAQGCWTDNDTHGRSLPSLNASDAMTIEYCAAYAKSKGYKYFGVEYGRECWAGATLSQYSSATASSSCAMKCKGDSSQICGGSGLMNLYIYSPVVSATISVSASSSASPISTGLASSSSSLSGQASISSSAGPVSTAPASDNTGVVDLSDAIVSHGEIVQEDGRTVIILEPSADGGEASFQVPASPPADIEPGTEMVVRAEIKATVLRRKRAVLTECTLSMYLGGVMIYSNNIWTTDGNYTTVTTMPTSSQGLTTLIIVEYCPGDATSVTIGDVSVGLPASRSSTSSPLSNTPQIPASSSNTFPSSLTGISSTTSSSGPLEQTTAYPPSSMAPPTASITQPPSSQLATSSIVTDTPLPVPTFTVPSYTTDTCRVPDDDTEWWNYGCTFSGADLKTTGLLAIATGVPVATAVAPGSNRYEEQYEICAGMCNQRMDCETWALDRSDSPDGKWACYLYSENIMDLIYAPTYDTDDIVYMARQCFDCATREPTAVPSSTSIAGVVSTSVPLTTTSAPLGITAAPSVVTYSAPSYTEDACSQPTYGPASCILSGAPVATSGLVAIATGVPVPDGPLIRAFQQCARVCASIDTCNSYALDRGTWPADTTSTWTCYFYSGYVNEYAVSYNSLYSAVVWFESGCYACDALDDDVGGSVSSTSSQSESSTLTSMPSTITTAPPGISNYVVAPYTASTCSKPNGYYSCTLSGAPVATSGLVGEATGVPVATGGNMAPAYEHCAGICDNLPGCNAWALDRGVGVYPNSQLDSWTCYFYSGSVSSYAVSYMSQYTAVVWFGNGCYDCNPQDLAVVAPSSSSTPSSSLPQTSSIQSSEIATASSTPTSSSPLITSAAVLTTSAPAYAPVCTNAVGSGCVLSGAPVATSGLIAVATGIPATPVSSNEGFEKQYTICARVCNQVDGCTSFALDRGSWPTDLSPWTCYFYTGGVREYAVSYNSQYAAVVWFANNCYQCLPELASTTSSVVAPESTSFRSISSLSQSSSFPMTITTAPLTTSAPAYALLSAAPYTSGVCSTKSVPGNQEPCAISGWPTPTSASGLLAIATGVAPVPAGVYNFAQPFEVCAGICADTVGCTLWALDRGDWPSDMLDWSCLLYDFDGRNYLLNTSPGSAYSKYAWSSDICYNCTLNEPVASSSTLVVTSNVATSSVTATSVPNTTPPPTMTVTTFSAPPLVTSCNKPTAAQWYTNGCTISGVPTATSGLVAVATGIVPPVTGNYNFEIWYQQCASICAGIDGCTGYALDRGNWPTDTSAWTCYFYGFDVASYLHGQTSSADYRSVVWMNELCFDCPVPGPWFPPSSSSTSPALSQSTSTSSTTSAPAASTTAAAACTRAPSPDSSLSCDTRGFKEPESPLESLYVIAQADCAAYCSQLREANTESCASYMWDPSTSLCAIWDVDSWTAIGDDAIAGKAYKNNVMDDFGCWECPQGAQVHAYPL